MSGYVLKDAEANLVFALDWRRGYLRSDERIAKDLGWHVTPTNDADAPLEIPAQGHDECRSWVWFSGGERGRVYIVAARVLSDQARVLERSIVVRIAAA
jgi:hypothetical protein